METSSDHWESLFDGPHIESFVSVLVKLCFFFLSTCWLPAREHTWCLGIPSTWPLPFTPLSCFSTRLLLGASLILRFSCFPPSRTPFPRFSYIPPSGSPFPKFSCFPPSRSPLLRFSCFPPSSGPFPIAVSYKCLPILRASSFISNPWAFGAADFAFAFPPSNHISTDRPCRRFLPWSSSSGFPAWWIWGRSTPWPNSCFFSLPKTHSSKPLLCPLHSLLYLQIDGLVPSPHSSRWCCFSGLSCWATLPSVPLPSTYLWLSRIPDFTSIFPLLISKYPVVYSGLRLLYFAPKMNFAWDFVRKFCGKFSHSAERKDGNSVPLWFQGRASIESGEYPASAWMRGQSSPWR